MPPLAMSDSEPPHLAANATKITYVDGRPTTITLRRFKVAVAEKGVVTEHTFDKDVITLGAMEGNDLVVDDDTVSREHCRIYVADGAYMIEDLDSTNGTFVNRVRIKTAWLNHNQITRTIKDSHSNRENSFQRRTACCSLSEANTSFSMVSRSHPASRRDAPDEGGERSIESSFIVSLFKKPGAETGIVPARTPRRRARSAVL